MGRRRTARPAGSTGLVDDPDLRAEIQAAVDEANKAVSQAEAIRKFSDPARDWTEEGGQLTPSLKLKRDVVMRAVPPGRGRPLRPLSAWRRTGPAADRTAMSEMGSADYFAHSRDA